MNGEGRRCVRNGRVHRRGVLPPINHGRRRLTAPTGSRAGALTSSASADSAGRRSLHRSSLSVSTCWGAGCRRGRARAAVRVGQPRKPGGEVPVRLPCRPARQRRAADRLSDRWGGEARRSDGQRLAGHLKGEALEDPQKCGRVRTSMQVRRMLTPWPP